MSIPKPGSIIPPLILLRLPFPAPVHCTFRSPSLCKSHEDFVSQRDKKTSILEEKNPKTSVLMRRARTYHAQSARAFSSVVPLQWQRPDLMLHLKLHHSSKLRQLSVPLHMKNQKPQANAGSSTMRKATLSPANTKCAPSQPHRNLLLSINKPAQVQHPQGRRIDCGPTNPQLTAEPSGGLFPSKMPVARTLFWLFLVYFSFLSFFFS